MGGVVSLVIPNDFVAKIKAPTSVSEIMTLKNNYFIVKHGDLYNYFRITLQPYSESDLIMRFDKHPPVLREGIVVINKKCYMVTLPDLMRGVIRKSRKLEITKNGTKSIATTAELTKSSVPSVVPISSGEPTIYNSDQQTASIEVENEICKQADLCWDEQVKSLLHSIHQEEGGSWEISDSVQPRPTNETDSIQDLERDPGTGTGS